MILKASVFKMCALKCAISGAWCYVNPYLYLCYSKDNFIEVRLAALKALVDIVQGKALASEPSRSCIVLHIILPEIQCTYVLCVHS